MDIREYKKGIQIFAENTNKFAVQSICLAFVLPIDNKTATGMNVVSALLLDASENRSWFYKRAEEMGGAKISCSAVKKGGYIILQVYGEALRKYSSQLLTLIYDIVFRADLSTASIERAKRLALDNISLSKSDKRAYAASRAIEILFNGKGVGTPADGYEDEIDTIDLNGFYTHLLEKAEIKLFTVGEKADEDLLLSNFCEREKIKVEKCELPKSMEKPVNEIEEVNQCRLCVGFGTEGSDYLSRAAAAELLGGSAGSRLFSTIREEQSLCYYVSAAAYRLTPILLVEAGISSDSVKKTADGIYRAINCFRVDEAAVRCAVRSIASGYRLIKDSPSGIMNFYLGQSLAERTENIDEYIKQLEQIKAETVITAVKGLYPAILYSLGGEENV